MIREYLYRMYDEQQTLLEAGIRKEVNAIDCCANILRGLDVDPWAGGIDYCGNKTQCTVHLCDQRHVHVRSIMTNVLALPPVK